MNKKEQLISDRGFLGGASMLSAILSINMAFISIPIAFFFLMLASMYYVWTQYYNYKLIKLE